MKRNKNITLMGGVFAGLSVIIGGAAWAQNPNASTNGAAERRAAQNNPVISGKEVSADNQFLMKAIQGNMAEIQMGQLALKQSKSQIVQDFAQRMVGDHTTANEQAMQLATRKGVTVPKSPDAASTAMMRRMSKMKTGFDKAYLNHMLTDHKKDVADYTKEARTGYDDDIKTYATTTLPTLQGHLTEVQTLINPTKGSITLQNTRRSPKSRPNSTSSAGTTGNAGGGSTGSGGQ
jgi:putative membrane protein